MRDLLRRQWQEFRLNLHPREYLYWLVQNVLLLFFTCATRVQLFGGGHYAPAARATILLSGHKRDWDPLLFALSLYYQRGWWRPDGRRMAFVGREDMFTPGFLAEIGGNPIFEQKEALSVVAQNVQLLAGQAALLERGLLDEKHLRQRLRAFLAYSVRHGVLRHISRFLYTINPAPFQVWPQNFAWLNPRYRVNELASLEAALAVQERSQVA